MVLSWELPTIWYEKISHGRVYWRLPFALALIFCPMHSWLLERKGKGEENRNIIEEELDLSPSPLSLYHSFDILIINCSVLSILGIEYIVEGIWYVAYNPELGWRLSIEVSNTPQTEIFYSFSTNKGKSGTHVQKLVKLGDFHGQHATSWLNACGHHILIELLFVIGDFRIVCKERCVFSGSRSGREVVGVPTKLPQTCLTALAKPRPVHTVSLDTEALGLAWWFGGVQAKHSRTPSVCVHKATGPPTPFRALGVKLTFERKPKHFQALPMVLLLITEVYCLVTSSQGPKFLSAAAL